MTTAQFRILLFSMLIVQILGFSLLWWVSGAPVQGARSQMDLATPTETVLEELQQIRAMRYDMDTSIQQAAIALPEAEALRSLVRQVLEEELESLAARADATPDTGANASAPVLDEARLWRREQAFAQSSALLNQALAAGLWTEANTLALLPLLADLSNEQIDQLSRRLNDALGRNAIRLEGPPPPL